MVAHQMSRSGSKQQCSTHSGLGGCDMSLLLLPLPLMLLLLLLLLLLLTLDLCLHYCLHSDAQSNKNQILNDTVLVHSTWRLERVCQLCQRCWLDVDKLINTFCRQGS